MFSRPAGRQGCVSFRILYLYLIKEAIGMSVVIVGGNERMECKYKDICKKRGCKAKVFT